MTEALAAVFVLALMLGTWGPTHTLKVVLFVGSLMISTMVLLELWKLLETL